MSINSSKFLMIGAISAILSASSAYAGTINVTVHNTGNPAPVMEIKRGVQSWQFPSSDGQHDVAVPNAMYNAIVIKAQGAATVAFCKEFNAPGAPSMKADLNGDDKKVSVIVRYDAANQSLKCYLAGG